MKKKLSLVFAAVLVGLCSVFCAPAVSRADTASVTVYRLYYAPTLDHHYTTDANEYRILAQRGWEQEGTAWKSAGSSARPVYRLYYAPTYDHHYTMDKNEYEVLASRGWEQEGVAWYSDDSSGVPVYRLYNAGTFDHHYTTDANEYRVLGQRGWVQEGVAWYGARGDVSNGGATATSGTPIMGTSQASASRLAAYYCSVVGEGTYPSSVYRSYGASTLDEFCRILVEEAQAEGVRAEVVFAQAMKETGWLRFGGAVKVEQCNFCGLGAVNSSPTSAASFSSVREGLRAQVQHLKAYASTAPLNNACVDPRFDLVSRGVAPTLEQLNGRWAVPGNGYGESIASMIQAIMALSV